MTGYIARRLVLLIPTLLGVTLLVFFMVRLAPGTILDLMVGVGEGRLSDEAKARIEARYGLDKPVPVQYFIWLGQIVRGDMGNSWRTDRPIGAEIKAAMPYTAELALVSVILALITGLPLGIMSAVYRNSTLDFVTRIFAILGLSFPIYWLAIMLILISSTYFHWLPPIKFVRFVENPSANFQQMLMPWFALALTFMPLVMRMTRSSMLEVMGQDYVRTARAKGLIERIVLYRHCLRNALIPVITIVGMQIGYLLGGTVIIEQIFGMPGMGWLLYRGVTQRDYAIVQATTLVFAVGFVLINLLVDILFSYVDPRIRYT
jgi:peptide/nickel transport system permease protein